MNALLVLSALALAVIVSLIFPAEGAAAVVFCAALGSLAGLFISRHPTQARFLVHVFVAALLVRVAVGALIYSFKLQDFFGGDAFTYDYQGQMYLEYWQGVRKFSELFGASIYRNWGMGYVVAAIYAVLGRNMLAVQFFNAVLGAATT
jgi:hypothetical protein